MRRIAVVNQKGGAGKTTTAVHLAVSLAKLRKRVLLVDLDGQGNATTYLGLQKGGDALLEMLLGKRTLQSAVQSTAFGVDVLAGGPQLEGLDVVLYMAKGATGPMLLKRHLETAEGKWDFALIDCPPNLGTATASALVAADEVLIPVQAEAMAAEGVARLCENIEEVKSVNAGLRVVGVLPCMTSARDSLSLEVEAALRESFGDLVFTQSIKRATKIAQSYMARKPMHAFDPKNPVLKAYDSVAKELVKRGVVAK
jgi:chromosome partitioning protein